MDNYGYESVNEAAVPFFLRIKQIINRLDSCWLSVGLSSDGLEQESCAVENFSTKGNYFFAAHNNSIPLLRMSTTAFIHSHTQNAHTVCLIYICP